MEKKEVLINLTKVPFFKWTHAQKKATSHFHVIDVPGIPDLKNIEDPEEVEEKIIYFIDQHLHPVIKKQATAVSFIIHGDYFFVDYLNLVCRDRARYYPVLEYNTDSNKLIFKTLRRFK